MSIENNYTINSGWANYGDEKFISHGGLFIKREGDLYRIVENRNIGEKHEVFSCIIDPTDRGIAWEELKKEWGMADSGDEELVICAYRHYGVMHFEGVCYKVGQDKAIEFLIDNGVIY